MTVTTADIVIIGGGISGLSLATELAWRKAGRIAVVDTDYVGGGNSTRNVGRVRRMQFTESLTRFAIAYQNKIEQVGDVLGFNILFRRGGYAILLYDDSEVDRMRTANRMHRRLGLKSELLSPADTLRVAPVLKGGEAVTGALYSPQDVVIHHDPMAWAYYRKARELGCRIYQGCRVNEIQVLNGAIAGLTTGQGTIQTPVVVNAAGPASAEVARLAGIRIPTAPLRKEVMVTMPVKPVMDCACTFYRPHEGWFNQTMRGEFVASVTNPREPFAYTRSSSFGFYHRTAAVIHSKAPALGDLKIIRSWAGMYDMTPDQYPLVGPTKALDGFYQHNGWSGRGLSMGAYASELLADSMLSGTLHAQLKPFDPDRFEGHSGDMNISQDYYARYDN